MKRILFFRNINTGLTILIVALAFVGCTKDIEKPGGPDSPQSESGQITPIGEVQGPAVTAIIGASGGTLVSADEQVHINVPAGAVDENTSFSIQRISNTNIAGIGGAYRLLPHGKTFLKPVVLKFSFDLKNFEGVALEALGIAYQDEKGIWQGSGAVYDSVAKAISINARHFSDWSLFNSFAINPVTTMVEPGKSITLNVVNYMSDDDLIPPVPGETKPIGPQRDATGRYIKAWNLAGGGVLTSNAKEAIYTAPSKMPSKNPVAVSVALKGPGNGQYLLVSNIYIGAEGITFRIDSGTWLHGTIPLGVVMANGIHSLEAAVTPMDGGAANAALSLKWSGYPSNNFLGWDKKMPWFLYQPPGNIAYQQFVVAGSSIIPSPGGIKFGRYTETPGGEIIGSFILERAGKREITGTGVTWSPVKIEGFFKTKRKTL